MDKRYPEIDRLIESRSEDFYNFLIASLTPEAREFVYQVIATTEAYVFSGVIRNYFLHKKEMRDLDIVIEDDVNLRDLFGQYSACVNSFGGYKFSIGGLKIDLWVIKKTWALKTFPTLFDKILYQAIPSTSFFNFSAVVFSLNNKRFIYRKEFASFVKSHKLDIVYPINPQDELCIVNTFYYSAKYNLPISKKLKKYIYYKHTTTLRNYEPIQHKHFGKVIFSNEEIKEKVEHFNPFKENLNALIKRLDKKHIHTGDLKALKEGLENK